MQIPIIYLTAGSRRDVPANTKVFNIRDVPYYLWVEITHEIASQFTLFDMHESTAKCDKEVSIDFHKGIVQSESPRPWIRITSAGISKSIGLHIYRLSFVHKTTGDILDRYFGYIIQCSNPTRPYDYMNRGCSCYGCVNCRSCKQCVPNECQQSSHLCSHS